MNSSIFEIIKHKISITDVISQYLTLKPAGAYLKGRCPFHHEKTASFTVSPHKEIFYCFGCHTGGDIINFVAKIERCTPLEATKLLADRYKIELPDEPRTETDGQSRERYHVICNVAAQWCFEYINQYQPAMTYLQQRGITQESIKQFRIGYFPSGNQGIQRFLAALKKYHLLPIDLVQANILAEGKTTLYSPFEDRIIFPINDHLGRCCGFGGRIFKPQDERPKYYNSKESDFFCKGSMLFGLENARTTIQNTGYAFLVEGYMDCIVMAQYGFTNTVATLGTACSLHHLKLLSRYAYRVYMLYDSDAAGKQAMLRLAHMCWQANLELFVVNLPTGHDPASFLVNNGELAPLVAQARTIFTFFIESLGADFKKEHLGQKVALARKLVETISNLDDPLKRDVLLHQACTALDIPFATLKQEEARILEKQAQTTPAVPALSVTNTTITSPDSITTLTQQLVGALINQPTLLTQQVLIALTGCLSDPLQHIIDLLCAIPTEQYDSYNSHIILDQLNEETHLLAIRLLVEQKESMTSYTFQSLLQRLLQRRWKTITQNIQQRLARARQTNNQQEEQRVLQQFITLRQQLLGSSAEEKN